MQTEGSSSLERAGHCRLRDFSLLPSSSICSGQMAPAKRPQTWTNLPSPDCPPQPSITEKPPSKQTSPEVFPKEPLTAVE